MATDDQNARLLAALGYAGFFIGFPTGLIPLLMRQDELSLHHGKVATAVWLGNFVVMSIAGVLFTIFTWITCGVGALLFPVLFLPLMWGLTTAVHGLVLALNGELEEPMGGFGLGDMFFGGITVQVPQTSAGASHAATEPMAATPPATEATAPTPPAAPAPAPAAPAAGTPPPPPAPDPAPAPAPAPTAGTPPPPPAPPAAAA
ncbi:MAG: hypothetical protein ACI9K2_003874, partial [Myxococcota bacterium]